MGPQGPMQAVCGRILVFGSAAVFAYKQAAVIALCRLGVECARHFGTRPPALLTAGNGWATICYRFFHCAHAERVLPREGRSQMKKTHESGNSLGPRPVQLHLRELEEPTCKVYQTCALAHTQMPSQVTEIP